VAYPGITGVVNLDIITSKLNDAKSNSSTSEQSQKFILKQFKKAYMGKFDTSIEQWLEWGKLTIKPIQLEPAAPDEDRHCCGDDRCTQCDLGYHERCRSGCTIARRW